MITTPFELTHQLTVSYLKSHVPSRAVLEKKSSSDSNVQYSLESTPVLFTTINSLAENVCLVTFVALNAVNESLVVDWDKIHVRFPINEICIPEDVIRSFNQLLEEGIKTKELKKVLATAKPAPNDGTDREGPDGPEPMPKPELSEWPQRTGHKAFERPPDMPDFEDELEIRARPRQQQPFPSIGDSDLNPPGLPKYPELKPYIDPLASGPNGMYPSSDHPLFGSRESGNTSRLGVPPGARFDDPYGEDNLEALGSGLPGTLGNLRGGALRKPDDVLPKRRGSDREGFGGFGGGFTNMF